MGNLILKTKSQSGLSAEITDKATSLVLEKITGFPSAPFRIIVDNGLVTEEVMLVTAVNDFTRTLTVVRAQQGTVAVAHDKLALVYHCDIDPAEISVQGGVIRVAKNTAIDTITKAMALVTTSLKTILVEPGLYEEAASVAWSDVDSVRLIGLGGDGAVVIRGASGAANVISINPAAAAGTWSAYLESITIKHRTGQVGLQVDNATVTKRINLYLKNIITDAEGTGNAIDVNRTGPSTDAIRIYADGNGEQIEGLVDFITESTDDRVRFKGYRLNGGLTVTGAVACEVTLISCGVKTGGLTVDGANKLTNVHCWYETDANPNVYTEMADAYATYS